MKEYFKLDNLRKTIGNFNLGPITFSLSKGDYLVLLGPTGCGKTTLLRCIAGITGKQSGQIFLNKSDAGIINIYKRNIGLVSQTGDLFPNMTVKENIMFGLKYQDICGDEIKKRYNYYMNLFQMNPLASRSIFNLSGGETKKVSMVRSLILEPDLLLLDEPLGMLDHNSRREVEKILKYIHKQLKTTVIHVTHDRTEAWEQNGLTSVMNDGRLVQMGTTGELVRKPVDIFCAKFLGGENIFDAVFDKNTAFLSWINIPVKLDKNYKKGWIIIRPEFIYPARGSSKGKISGRVYEMDDCGEYCRIKVSITNTENRLIFYSSFVDKKKLFLGKKINLDWDKEAPHVIYDKEGGEQ